MIFFIILIISILGASGLCSMVEAAILSIPTVRVRILYEKKKKGSSDLLFIKENIHAAVATIVILNNAVNIIGAVFVGQIVANFFGSQFLGICSAALTISIIVLSEVIPKTIGEHYKVPVSLWSAKVLRGCMWLFNPLIKTLEFLMKPFRKKKKGPWVTEEEIKMLLRLGRVAGTVEVDEERLINRVFKLNDLTARQMMRSISEIYALDGDKTLAEQKEHIVNSPFSRIAVYKEKEADIVGICQQRTLLREIANDNYTAKIKDFMTGPIFVDAEERADILLEKFQTYHQHLFIVQDKTGKKIGLITMEDVLEELFGEIYDEKDAFRQDNLGKGPVT